MDMNTETNSPLKGGSSQSACSAWTDWPTHTGQQFVCKGEADMYVGSVEVDRKDSVYGLKLLIWRGSGYSTIYEKARHPFKFQSIAWPDKPNAKLSHEEGGKDQL
jgi:hypothetical protein